jgi:hypothetical protein
MGYFVPHRIGDLAAEPAVTPREYGSALYSAIEQVVQNSPRGYAAYERGIALLVAGRPHAATRAFTSFVRLRPEDPVGHRMLGLAHLNAGHFVAGLGHLVIALKILRHDAGTTMTLRDSLRLHLEAALVRLLLLPLCERLGDREAVKRLMFESFTL